MERDLKWALTTLFAAVLLMITSMMLGIKIGYRRSDENFAKQDTIIIHDTLIIIPDEEDNFSDSILAIKPERIPVQLNDTVWIHDTCYIYVGIEHHKADIGDFGEIWYSGFKARIDSLRLLKTTKLITETEPAPRRQQRQNTIAIIAGFDEASVMYTRGIGRFIVGASAGYTFDKHPTARGIIGLQF